LLPLIKEFACLNLVQVNGYTLTGVYIYIYTLYYYILLYFIYIIIYIIYYYILYIIYYIYNSFVDFLSPSRKMPGLYSIFGLK
jgi:hypothetical protein